MFNKKRLIIVILIFAALVAGVLTNAALKNYLLETEVSQLKFQTGMEYDTIAYGKDILLVNHEGILALNRSGHELWNIVCASTSPTVSVSGKYIMLADMNGKDVHVYKEDKLITQIKTEKEILSAKMNKNGYVAVATADLGYKGMVTVYDKSGNEIFKWHSGAGYIGGMDISPKNQIALAQIMTDRDKVYSKIIRLNIKKDGETENIAEIDGIIMEVSFRENGSFTAVSNEGVYGFKKNGKAVYSTSFGGRVMESYNIENEHNMVFAFDNGRNGTMLESYSQKGELRGSYDAEDEIRNFDVSGECIAIGTAYRLLRITPTGKLKGEWQISHDVRRIKVFGSRDRVIVIGGDSADLMKI